MDFTNIFRLVNIAVGVFMVLGGISNFFTGTWSSFILGAYAVVFGLGRSRRSCERYASFLFSFLGRGVFYIFIGSILLHDHVLRIIDGSLIAFIGLGYVALEFIPSIEPPSNMRESDQGWGAEQV